MAGACCSVSALQGFGQVPAVLEKGLEIKLNSPVAAIDYSDNITTVSSSA
jgi:hypothetical protein